MYLVNYTLGRLGKIEPGKAIVNADSVQEAMALLRIRNAMSSSVLVIVSVERAPNVYILESPGMSKEPKQ